MLDFITQHGFLISQILVGIAIITDFLSFQFKERKYVLIFLTLSSVLITIHYLLLGEINAFYLMIISTLSFLVSIFTVDKRIMYMFFILYLFPIVLNYSGLYDLLLFIGLYFMLVAKFMKDDKQLRILIMIATLFGIIFNIIVFTPVGVLLQVLFLGSNLLGYYRYYLKESIKKI